MTLPRRLLFSLAAVLIALAGIEAAARLTEPWIAPSRAIPLPAPHAPGADPAAFRPRFEQEQAAVRARVQLVRDDRSGWALPPTTGGPARIEDMGRMSIRINTLGIRGPEVPPPEQGEIRLLSLGDSSIFGVMVAERCVLHEQAAADMARAGIGAVRAFNGGVPGYDSAQSLQMLRRIGPEIRPAWVIIGNLWSDVFRRDDLQRGRQAERIAAPMRALAAWRVGTALLSPWLEGRKVGWIDGAKDVGSLDDGGVPPRMPLADYLRNLRDIAALARDLGARPAFLVLPAPMDFDAVPPPETVRAYRDGMRAVAQELGAPLVDGPAIFLEHGGIGWFEDHVHPSQAGHTLLGHALARALLAADPATQDLAAAVPWDAQCE